MEKHDPMNASTGLEVNGNAKNEFKVKQWALNRRL